MGSQQEKDKEQKGLDEDRVVSWGYGLRIFSEWYSVDHMWFLTIAEDAHIA